MRRYSEAREFLVAYIRQRPRGRRSGRRNENDRADVEAGERDGAPGPSRGVGELEEGGDREPPLEDGGDREPPTEASGEGDVSSSNGFEYDIAIISCSWIVSIFRHFFVGLLVTASMFPT